MSSRHSDLVGCNLVDDKTSTHVVKNFLGESVNRYARKICLTHSLTVCHCGYEIGWHNDEESKLLNPKTTWKSRSEKVKARWRAWHKRRKALHQV